MGEKDVAGTKHDRSENGLDMEKRAQNGQFQILHSQAKNTLNENE